jgi:hypothetical protein
MSILDIDKKSQVGDFQNGKSFSSFLTSLIEKKLLGAIYIYPKKLCLLFDFVNFKKCVDLKHTNHHLQPAHSDALE